MALIGFEGFDSLASISTAAVTADIVASKFGAIGAWSSTMGGPSKKAGLLGGFGISGTGAGSGGTLTLALNANYATLIVGQRWQAPSLLPQDVVRFMDGATVQCGLSVNAAGFLIFWRGTTATVLATGTTPIVASSWYMIDAMATINNTTGAFTVNLSGVQEFTASSQNTRTSANNQATGFSWIFPNSTLPCLDDVYACDTTGPAPYNAPLGVTRIETLFVAGADSIAWSPLTPTLVKQNTASTQPHTLNTIYFDSWAAPYGGSLRSVDLQFNAASITGNVNVALYDSSNTGGTPGNLIATATAVNNPTGGTTQSTAPWTTFTFASPPTLVAGTTYWLGINTDTTYNLWGWNTAQAGGYAASYNSGVFPSTITYASFTANAHYVHNMRITYDGQSALMVGEAANDGDTSYNSTSSSAIDTFLHAALSSTPSTIYALDVISSVKKDDVTAVTYRNKLISGATTSNGASSNLATLYTFVRDSYQNDPNTGAPWTAANVNASKIGYERV